ncbi:MULTISPECIES: hypothetical protein [Calothrix]|uniref:Uncharacterized protein n=2 Tax=Calothrix TaxID=1186 RepID=A0ABR8A4D1_9CYAN|nr:MULTISPECIES: hypothetical protein [Calothrix]MBD2194623.1 hypothetical protein [Calothrix parietina FACHB-288]MBD2223271.1 hypothetical protein [Calothrix anomala FACHB-343]
MVTHKSKAEALAEYYAENGWRTQPLTITYLEDADPNTWEAKPNQPDAWNDVRILWQPKEGKVIVSCSATTEPGIKAVNNPMNSNGTFRIGLDTLFKDAWEVGKHITKSSNQLALVQCGEVLGYRDANKDHIRTGDKTYAGSDFGINQHTTGNSADSPAPDTVGAWSYGCLVGKHPSTHYNLFMPACQESGQTKFDTVVIDASKFQKWLQSKDYSL